jgi:UPF0288 family protein (methanogenesis marker protein 3)
MKSSSKQNPQENYLEFYTDYYGNYLKANGVAYKASEVVAIRTHAQSTSNHSVQTYEIELSNGIKGRLRINSKAANYKGASRFITKCKELLNLDA